MNFRGAHRLVFMLCVFLVISTARVGHTGAGDCSTVDFESQRISKDSVDYFSSVRVLSNGVNLYSTKQDNSSSGVLEFDTDLDIHNESHGRVLVSNVGQSTPIGWVDKSDLLCVTRPLQSKSGIERKIFVKTPSVEVGSSMLDSAITPSLSKQVTKCAGDNCTPITKYDFYFVFDENETGVLIADNYRLENRVRLRGWVKKGDVYEWNTAYALRPGIVSELDPVQCVFVSKEDAIDRANCNPVPGDESWLRSPDRIPLLSREGELYKVAYTSRRTVGDVDAKDGVVRVRSKYSSTSTDEYLQRKKNKDIFFLIDGTASMNSVINSIRGSVSAPGLIQSIQSAVLQTNEFSSDTFRFGYRVFRDEYYSKSNEFDSMPLTGSCAPTKEEQQINQLLFRDNVSKIEVSANDKDDFSEDLYGGLLEALSLDMGQVSCENNQKILFVIGDAGYDQTAHEKPVSLAELEGAGKWGVESVRNFVIPWFIRTKPAGDAVVSKIDRSGNARSDEEYENTRKSYDDAYSNFGEQAYSIIRGFGGNPSEQFLEQSDGDIVDQIVRKLKVSGSGEQIDELVFDLRSGMAFLDSLERVKKMYPNTPNVVWNLYSENAKALENYDHRIFDEIFEGYVRSADNFIPEVWLKNAELTNWSSGVLGEIDSLQGMRGQEVRSVLVNSIVEGLHKVIKEPPLIESGESITEYILRSGKLPLRTKSPLFSYDDHNEMMDSTKVPKCEIRLLANWAIRVNEVLKIVLNDRKPVLELANSRSECAGATDNYNNIPEIIRVGSERLCSTGDECTFSHNWRNSSIYWVPDEYLP